MSIEDERGRRAAELAPLLRRSAAEVERAIQEQHTRRPKDKRNLVSTLASVAQLAAMLRLFPERERDEWLLGVTADAVTRRERALAGELVGITVELCDHLAGPYEVLWDGNWPSAAPRLRGRIPATARPGDVIIGGDGGGGRTALLVTADDDGVTTGEVFPGTWRDPP